MASHSVLLTDLQELLKIETRHGHQSRSVGHGTIHQHLHPVDVEERQDRDPDIIAADLDNRLGLSKVADQIAVSEHHTLRQSSRTR